MQIIAKHFPWHSVLHIFTVFISFAAMFVMIIPPFENSDELEHAAYVAYWAILITGADNTAQLLNEARQQRYQAPLYYLSCLPMALALSIHTRFQAPERNPEFRWIPVPPGQGPHRLYQAMEDVAPPMLQATARNCLYLRVISICWALSAGLVMSVWFWIFSRYDQHITTLGTILFMFNPSWVETAASVSNDAAATCLAASCILYMTKILIKKDNNFFISIV